MYDLVEKILIYNKFNEEMLPICIEKNIVDTLIIASEVCINFLKEEQVERSNPFLKDDIIRMNNISKKLNKMKAVEMDKFHFSITVAEFLIFKYCIETIKGMICAFRPRADVLENYDNFIDALKKIYCTLNENHVRLYYEFVSAYDDNPNINETLN